MPCRSDAGSTPRQNRWPASVEKVNRRERPASPQATRYAFYRRMRRVSSDTGGNVTAHGTRQ